MNTKIKTLLAAGAAIVSLSLSGCGASVEAQSSGNKSSQPAVEPATNATPTQSPTDTAKKSPRGNTVRALGEASYWKESGSVPDDKASGRFTVTDISPATCTKEYARPSSNGKYIALTIDVETYATLADKSVKMVFLNPMEFKYIAPNGTSFNGSLGTIGTYSCVDDSQKLPSSFGPGEKAHGVVVLDVPNTAGGVLTLGNVEWNLP